MIPPLLVLAQWVSPPAPPTWPLALFLVGITALLWELYRRAYKGRRASSTPPNDRHDGGSVYVLSNSGYDNLVKVGYTTRDVATRAEELSADTAVPGTFEVEHETKVANPEAVEQAVHERLAAHKVNKDREFFEVSPNAARRAIEHVLGPDASIVRQGLGALLCALAVFVTLALATYHPADDKIVQSVPALEAVTHLEGGSTLPPTQNALGLSGAWLAHVLVPEFLGYLALVPAGLAALWGFALARGRSLRPLLAPTSLVLLDTLAAGALIGWFGHANRPAPIGWAGEGPYSSSIVHWAGTAGLDLAAGLRAGLGPPGSLALLVVAAGGCIALLARWGRPATNR